MDISKKLRNNLTGYLYYELNSPSKMLKKKKKNNIFDSNKSCDLMKD